MTSRTVTVIAISILAQCGLRANRPDYLTNDRPPADSADQFASPFEARVAKPSAGRLGAFSEEPFIRDAELSLQLRLYFRYTQNSSGLHEAFAGGGALAFTTGWWRDNLQLGVVGYTTQPSKPQAAGVTPVCFSPMAMGFPSSARLGPS